MQEMGRGGELLERNKEDITQGTLMILMMTNDGKSMKKEKLNLKGKG